MAQELREDVTEVLPLDERSIDLEPRQIEPTEVPESSHRRLDYGKAE
jgi:hypothetical protein